MKAPAYISRQQQLKRVLGRRMGMQWRRGAASRASALKCLAHAYCLLAHSLGNRQLTHGDLIVIRGAYNIRSRRHGIKASAISALPLLRSAFDDFVVAEAATAHYAIAAETLIGLVSKEG